MLAVVYDLTLVDRLNEKLALLGYAAKGEFGIPKRRFFMKGGAERTHHLHVFLDGSPDITRHLALPAYLRSRFDEVERYGALKLELAALYPHSIESYIAGKDGLVKELEVKALEFWRNPAP